MHSAFPTHLINFYPMLDLTAIGFLCQWYKIIVKKWDYTQVDLNTCGHTRGILWFTIFFRKLSSLSKIWEIS